MNAHDLWLIVSAVIVTRIYVWVLPHIRRAFAQWRHLVWTERVRAHRAHLLEAIDAGDLTREALVEADLNFALRRQAKWRMRPR